ncbi:MAG TPA: type VI secretion system tube protein Hcp [Acidobacteriaceae bacterium]
MTCGAIAATAVPAFAAVDAYMTFGTGKGETKVHVTSVSQQTAAPRDMATGMASGKRMHKPFTITKEIDKASPMLMRLMQSHDTLPEVTVAFTGGAAGKANTAEKIVLKNAMVTSVKQSGTTETLTLNYEQIEVTYTNGGKTAMDDWESPK